MTVYTIEVTYETGDSMDHYEVVDEVLGITSTDLAIAKENLRRIKTQFHEIGDLNNYGGCELTLLTDKGERTIDPFWLGYHENLIGVKIAIKRDDDMEFYPK